MPHDALKFSLGQCVYHKIEPEVSGLITGVCFRPSGCGYFVTWPTSETPQESFHYEIELTTEAYQTTKTK